MCYLQVCTVQFQSPFISLLQFQHYYFPSVLTLMNVSLAVICTFTSFILPYPKPSSTESGQNVFFSDFTKVCVMIYSFHSSNKYFSVKTFGVIFYYMIVFYSTYGSDQQKWNECIISEYTGCMNLFHGIAFMYVQCTTEIFKFLYSK